jgi:hypothetical protein
MDQAHQVHQIPIGASNTNWYFKYQLVLHARGKTPKAGHRLYQNQIDLNI